MIVKLLRIVFLLNIRIKFTKGKSIVDIIRSRYEKPLFSPYSLRDKHTMRTEQTSANIFRYNDYIYA